MTPAELIKRLNAVTTVEEWLTLMHRDAEFQLVPNGTQHRGLDAIRRYAEHAVADPDRPQPSATRVTSAADRAVVRGQLKFVRRVGESAFTSVEAVAWLVTVDDGKLRSVRAFRNAAEAERAAAFSADEPTRDHVIGRFLLPLVRRLLPPARRTLTSSA